jgi:hypothetical protein
MRVVFLDIDGVLNNPGTYCSGAPWRREEGERLRVPIEPECMDRLNRLVAENDAKVVISSSWRLFAKWEELGPALERYGLVGEVIGETPDLVNDAEWLRAWREREGAPFHYERMQRGWEIREYLIRNPEVDSFVILDDCSDMEYVVEHFILIDPIIGLDDPDVERAKLLFQRGVTCR